jgi:lipoprotein LprG
MQTRHHAARTVWAFLALLLSAVLLVAGCSSSNNQSGPLPDGANLVKTASATTKGQQSVHLDLSVTGTIPGLPIETLTGDLTNAPAVAAKGKATIIFLGQRLEGVEFVVLDGDLYGALTPNNWRDFGPAADIYDVSAILNPDLGLANVLANFADPKSDAHETVGGVNTVRVTGKASADAVNKIAPQIAATAPVNATAWIRPDGKNDLVQVKLEPTPGNSVTMTLSDWGKQVTVTKPTA